MAAEAPSHARAPGGPAARHLRVLRRSAYQIPERPNAEPDCLVLEPEPGVPTSPRPPVRIFLGSEPAQERAERVFIWSVARHRDRRRRYEIHLMKELTGFDRRGWTTGFTNYRFAIPHFAQGRGKAIYNDTDQVYRSDPGELFDLELGEHGYLAIAGDDCSVMLLDCERMNPIWTLDDAQHLHKNEMVERALRVPGTHGKLAPHWNSRDDELPLGSEKVIHFTTLHMQPWRPFPERFVYHDNPRGDIWHGLEAEADAAPWQVYDRKRPSRHYETWRSAHHEAAAGEEGLWQPPAPGTPARDPAPVRDCVGSLAGAPQEDVPWLLDDLLCGARRVRATLPWDGRPASAARWQSRFEVAGRLRPETRWELELLAPEGRVQRHCGGPGTEAPRVWVLVDDRPGNRTQSIGLADALGWPYEVKTLHCGPLSGLHNRLLGASRLGISAKRSAALAAPWPDLIIAAGRRTAPVAQWIRARAEGRPRIVTLGRKAGDDAAAVDLAVVPSYARLFPHPKRLEIGAPLHRLNSGQLEASQLRWQDPLGGRPAPRIAVLVGGSSGQYRIDPPTARQLAQDVCQMARERGGSVMATTSRRLSPAASHAFQEALDEDAWLHLWRPEAADNPYLGFLALADIFVITADSESMLAEATSLGRPVYVYPLPVRASFRWLSRPREWVWRRAQGTPDGPRGTPRPQRGLERLCARLIDKGFVRPPRDLKRLHAALRERGLVASFGNAVRDDYEPAPLHETPVVVARVHALMGRRP